MRLFIFGLLSLSLLARPSSAEPSPNEADIGHERRAAFTRGQEAMRSKDWRAARAIYEQLWSERRTYDVALQLGQVFLNLEDHRSAAEYLDFGLRNAAPRERPEVLERSRQLLELAQKEIVTLEVSVDQAGAEVLIDGASLGVSPLTVPIFLVAGQHRLEAHKEGFVSAEQLLQASAGQVQRVTFALVRQAPPESPPAKAAVAPAAHRPANGEPLERSEPEAPEQPSWLPVYLGAGATLAGAAVGAGFALAAGADADDSEAILARVGPSGCVSSGARDDCSTLRDLAQSYDRHRALSTAGFVVAGASAASTLIYFLMTRPDRERVGSVHRFAVTAGASSTAASLRLSGSF